METIYSLMQRALMCCLLLFFSGLMANAQTLQDGDLAIVGVNRNTTPAEIAIVALSRIPSGTKIYICDYPYSNTAGSFVNTTNTSEGSIEWTTNAVINKGTVMLITINGATIPATVSGLSGTVNVKGWSSGNVASTPIPAGGDNLFIYQGTNDTTPSKFIFGWTNYATTSFGSANGWVSNGTLVATNTSTSELPPGLTNGVNAISLSWPTASGGSHGDNNAYKGSASGIKTTLLSAICTVSNWEHDETLTYKLTSTSSGTTQNTGNPYLSSFAVVNSAPAATSVTNTGVLEFDSTLYGNYVFTDINGDTDSGSTFRWFRSDSATGVNKTVIPGATGKTYQLTAADITRYISFEVTPSDGSSQGTPVESALRGPVTGVVMPVKLLSFHANCSDNYIRLDWTVASESNNREFRLYRMTGNSESRLIAVVAGRGNSMVRTTYSCKDMSPVKGFNYYRIEQVDMDGNKTQLSSSGAYFQPAIAEPVVIYPNPATYAVTVSIIPGAFKQAMLLDMNGNPVNTLKIGKDETELTFDLSVLPAGTYLIQLTDGNHTEQKKVVRR
jgi:hypothetical protein